MTEPFDVSDPVFISYRQSDGTAITSELAWLLRAAGIPVWRDKDDLPPGDTEERLAQAIADGLSGGILVITPEVAKSEVVKTVEAPRLIALHQKRPEFTLGIANAIERAPGRTDYTAPDRLLGLSPKTLEGTDQKSADHGGLRELVQGLLWQRIAAHRTLVVTDHFTFSLSIQTRNLPQVYDRTGAQLDIRVRPSTHERLPDAGGLRDLALTIGLLPDAVTRSGAQRVRVTGGAHLSVAFALGASLPSSRIGRIDVVDQRGVTWASGDEATIHDPAILEVKSEGSGAPPTGGRPHVAVYLDLLPEPSNAAFARYLEERGPGLVAWQHLASVQPGLLDPGQAAAIAGEAAARIRGLSTANANAHVHLLLRSPFPIAVLIGRLMNTVRLTVYEWDDTDPVSDDDFGPRYVPTMIVRASAADGAISEVLV